MNDINTREAVTQSGDASESMAMTSPTPVRLRIMEFLDGKKARHSMAGYPYAVMAAEYLVMHGDIRMSRQLHPALLYVSANDPAGRDERAIDRCIRGMAAQMDWEETVKELIFAAVDFIMAQPDLRSMIMSETPGKDF